MSYVPMKKLSKQQQKFLQKPWFTTAIQSCRHISNVKTMLQKNIYIKNIKVTEISYSQS